MKIVNQKCIGYYVNAGRVEETIIANEWSTGMIDYTVIKHSPDGTRYHSTSKLQPYINLTVAEVLARENKDVHKAN